MPLAIQSVSPDTAFTVQYNGKPLTIYHAYEDDILSRKVDGVYTADEMEGVRKGQRYSEGMQGDYGFTSDDDRYEFFFNTHLLFEIVKSFPEFQHPTKKYQFQWNDSFIVQVAINYKLIDFDDEGRMIINEIKEVSNG